MVSEPFQSYGIREATNAPSLTDKAVEDVRVMGYTVVPGVLSLADLVAVRQKLDEIYQVQVKEIGGERRLETINDKDIVRLPLVYDDYFLKVASDKTVLNIITGLLGDYYIVGQQNGIINLPNRENYQVSWHRDLSHQHFVSSRPLAISALFCIDDFSIETGGTYVLSASHKTEAFPSRGFIEKNELCVQARAGSVLIFDSMLFHRAGHNSSSAPRRAINHLYTLPFIKQQISIPSALQGKFSDNAFFNKLLGYASEPGIDVRQWRSSKIDRGAGA